MYLMVMPGNAVFGDSDDGWEAGFDDATFSALWDLGKQARQQYQRGEDLSGGDPVTYLMSIGCGDFYQWHARVSEAFAGTGEGATAELARQLFGLIANPPPDATR
jgi:hypothetical protein